MHNFLPDREAAYDEERGIDEILLPTQIPSEERTDEQRTEAKGRDHA